MPRAVATFGRSRGWTSSSIPASGTWARGRTFDSDALPADAGWFRGRFWQATVTVTTAISVQVGVGYEVNGRTRGFEATATVTAPAVPPPAHVGFLPLHREIYPAPTIIEGQPYANSDKDPWVPTSETTFDWGAFDILIAGVNVSYFRTDNRGRLIQTIITRLTNKDPGGDDQLDLFFPAITSLDRFGVGDLAWLFTDAPVQVRKLHPTTHVVMGTMYYGVVGPIEDVMSAPQSGAPASSTVVHCVGLWTRLDDFITLPRPSIDGYITPIPIGHLTPVDSAQFIYGHIHRAQLYGWPGSFARPANSGIPTEEQGNYGEPIASQTVQKVLAEMQTATEAYTIASSGSRLILRPRVWDSHVDFSLRVGQRGEQHSLTIDPTQAFNAFYGQGQAPYGPVDPSLGRPDAISDWANWQYPWAIDAIPAYPLGTGEDFNAGDSHDGFQPFSDELRAHGYRLSSQDTYLTSDVDEVERFQSNSGITVDGVVGPQTWNTAFQTGINTRILASAYIKEIYTGSLYSPFLTNARGAILRPNPTFDPLRHPRREILEQYGPVKKSEAALSAKQEFVRIRLPIYRGTVTAVNMDPPEIAALDTLAGMTMELKNHKGVDRRFYVAQVEKVPGMMPGNDRTVTWTVSEKPEGLMTLAQRVARDQGIKDVVASIRPPRHSSKQIPNWPAFDGESGAGILNPGQAQTGGLWNRFLVPMGGQVDVSAVKIVASENTKMAAAMFANPYLTVEKLIALPGLANPSVGADDPWAKNQDTLLTYGICWATGNPTSMQGYWPNQPGEALTGVLADTAPWTFRANGVWGALFVWTQNDCQVHGDPASDYRVIFPQPISGA